MEAVKSGNTLWWNQRKRHWFRGWNRGIKRISAIESHLATEGLRCVFCPSVKIFDFLIVGFSIPDPLDPLRGLCGSVFQKIRFLAMETSIEPKKLCSLSY
jgi:hypothetical protein